MMLHRHFERLKAEAEQAKDMLIEEGHDIPVADKPKQTKETQPKRTRKRKADS